MRLEILDRNVGMEKFDLNKYLAGQAVFIEKNLSAYVAEVPDSPSVLKAAMDYSLQAGGKRLRPALVISAAEAFGVKRADSAPAACAIEMVHTYSLIHDDLPALDNDALRRGKPTSHKVFGEAAAILAGDALLTLAFETCAKCGLKKAVGPARALKAMAVLAREAGASGMVGGQVSDIFAEGLLNGEVRRMAEVKGLGKKPQSYFILPAGVKKFSHENALDFIHLHKTAALIRAGVEMGAALGGAKAADFTALSVYGDAAGLAFQITDDILDVTADKKMLGKLGSDKDNGKLTYVTLYGIEKSRLKARREIERAKTALDSLSGADRKKLVPLYGLADFILKRTY